MSSELLTWIRVASTAGCWVGIVVWFLIGRDIHRRLTKAEDQIGIVAKWLLDHKFDEHKHEANDE